MTVQSRDQRRTLDDLLFVGFNSRVLALDRYSGEVVWQWKSPEGKGYVTLLLDGDRLIVSVVGYMYCLDPLYGAEVWKNPLRGTGTGVAAIVSMRGVATSQASAAAHHAAAAAAAAGAAAAGGAAAAAAS